MPRPRSFSRFDWLLPTLSCTFARSSIFLLLQRYRHPILPNTRPPIPRTHHQAKAINRNIAHRVLLSTASLIPIMGAIDPALAAESGADASKQIPPISAALPPHQQQPPDYRNLPAPQQMYPQAYAQPVIHHGYPPPAHPAPRQRTAIACRYCRRRKVRDFTPSHLEETQHTGKPR